MCFQEALQKANLEHGEEIKQLREDFDQKLREAAEKKEALSLAHREKEQTLENLVENLKDEIESSKEDYKNLMNGLDSGNNEYLM